MFVVLHKASRRKQPGPAEHRIQWGDIPGICSGSQRSRLVCGISFLPSKGDSERIRRTAVCPESPLLAGHVVLETAGGGAEVDAALNGTYTNQYSSTMCHNSDICVLGQLEWKKGG